MGIEPKSGTPKLWSNIHYHGKRRFELNLKLFNNRVKYETIIMEFNIITVMIYNYNHIQVMGVSQLVIYKIIGIQILESNIQRSYKMLEDCY